MPPAIRCDVIKLRQQIEQLDKQGGGSAIGQLEHSNNPDYIQLAAQLQAIEQNINSEQSLMGDLQTKIQNLQASLQPISQG